MCEQSELDRVLGTAPQQIHKQIIAQLCSIIMYNVTTFILYNITTIHITLRLGILTNTNTPSPKNEELRSDSGKRLRLHAAANGWFA